MILFLRELDWRQYLQRIRKFQYSAITVTRSHRCTYQKPLLVSIWSMGQHWQWSINMTNDLGVYNGTCLRMPLDRIRPGQHLFGWNHGETGKQNDMSHVPNTVNITTSGPVSDDNFAKMKTFCFNGTYQTFPSRLYNQVSYYSAVGLNKERWYFDIYFSFIRSPFPLIGILCVVFGGVLNAHNWVTYN